MVANGDDYSWSPTVHTNTAFFCEKPRRKELEQFFPSRLLTEKCVVGSPRTTFSTPTLRAHFSDQN